MSSGRGTCLLLLQLIQYGMLWSVKGEWFIEYHRLSVLSYTFGPPAPPPQASVGELNIQRKERQRGGEPIRIGRGVGGPKSYDSTETLLFFILFVFLFMHGCNWNIIFCVQSRLCPEAEFSDVIGTKVLRIFLLAIHITSTNAFLSPSSPPPLSKSQKWFETLICYGHLKRFYETKHCSSAIFLLPP